MEIIPKPDSEYHQVNHYFQLANKGCELLIYPDGDKLYYLNGLLHRESAPAIYRINRSLHKFEAWYIHNKFHRLSGPARTWANGEKQYFIDNEYYTQNQYWEKIFATEKYVKELVKFCPICETYFESREEVAIHLDQEMENKTDLSFNNEILIKRINLIINGKI